MRLASRRFSVAARPIPNVPASSGLPGERLPLLRRMLENRERPVRILETHSGLTGLIVETARGSDGSAFDGMWSSSLTASVAQGKPDIETVDTTARLELVRQTLSVTTKPMIYDADSGGQAEIFKFTVRALQQLGVSAAIIEDKTGLKQNSLFGTDRAQVLEDIDAFCAKIEAGNAAKIHDDFMVIARMESLIAGFGMDEALSRAAKCTDAGADAIMIHSREKSPEEVLEFIAKYKAAHGAAAKPIVCVPSSYNVIYEDELHAAGAAICIYANHLLRASYPAMLSVAESILDNKRSLEVDSATMPIKAVLTLVEEDAGGGIKQA